MHDTQVQHSIAHQAFIGSVQHCTGTEMRVRMRQLQLGKGSHARCSCKELAEVYLLAASLMACKRSALQCELRFQKRKTKVVCRNFPCRADF